MLSHLKTTFDISRNQQVRSTVSQIARKKIHELQLVMSHTKAATQTMHPLSIGTSVEMPKSLRFAGKVPPKVRNVGTYFCKHQKHKPNVPATFLLCPT